jgi:tRNA U34 5-methylaminomethyl-2-thiouridine-forming methyltransferase MnmC
VEQLNYIQQLKAQNDADIFASFHRLKPDKISEIRPNFSLTLNNELLENFDSKLEFNLIYFDAFGPEIQPELWTVAIFKKMYDALLPKGILVTYSAKGQVRRNMQQVGFVVERLEGPPGKREMLRAFKP